MIIKWVPSHQSIQGNDVDQLAKTSLSLREVTKIPTSSADLKKRVSAHYNEAWKQTWSKLSADVRAFKPELGSTVPTDIPRPSQVVITRLRLETCKLTHGHYFTRTPRAMCSRCKVPMTLKHLFIDCAGFQTPRQALQKACSRLKVPMELNQLFHPNYPATLILHYLSDTAHIEKI